MSAPVYAVRLQAGDVHFPDYCAACYGPAEVSYGLTAERGVDFVAFRFVHWVDLALPLCRRCRRRRRSASVLALIGLLAGMIALILAPVILTGDNVSTELALLLVALVYGLVILYRWRARPLIDWKLLGVRARLLKGAGSPVELRFGRAEYFESWAQLNRASAEPALR